LLKTVELPCMVSVEDIETRRKLTSRELHRRAVREYSDRHHRALMVIDYIERGPRNVPYLAHRLWLPYVSFGAKGNCARRMSLFERAKLAIWSAV
jgi:hypothetical protein